MTSVDDHPRGADRPGGGHRPHAGRPPGRDRGAHLLRARHPRAVPRSGLLSHARPAPLRRPRARRADLRPGHRPPRPRLPVDRVAGLPAHGARAAGRRVVRGARPGRALRRPRLPVPLGGRPGRQARPTGDGFLELTGTHRYCSGAPYATHYLGQTLPAAGGPPMLFVAPRSEWTMLDDWGHTLGLKGSGSNSLVFDGGRIPEYFALPDTQMLHVDNSGGTPGQRLHGNPMYLGRALSFFGLEFIALAVGMVKGALDEYARAHHDAHDPPPADRPARPRSRLPALVRPRAREGRHRRGGDAQRRRPVDGGLPAPGRGRRALRRRGGPADPVDHARVGAPVLGRAAGVRLPHGGLERRPRRRSGCSASGATCRWSGATSRA